ncbi:MAG: hypothetical protein AAFW46_18410 [Pseudomonadota bacterium]
MATTAGVASLTFLASRDDVSLQLVREVAPLALLVGAIVGFVGFPRQPRSRPAGAVRGVAVVASGLVLFLIAYATADAAIESAVTPGISFAAVWAEAAARVFGDLAGAGPAALATGGIAGALTARG